MRPERACAPHTPATSSAQHQSENAREEPPRDSSRGSEAEKQFGIAWPDVQRMRLHSPVLLVPAPMYLGDLLRNTARVDSQMTTSRPSKPHIAGIVAGAPNRANCATRRLRTPQVCLYSDVGAVTPFPSMCGRQLFFGGSPLSQRCRCFTKPLPRNYVIVVLAPTVWVRIHRRRLHLGARRLS